MRILNEQPAVCGKLSCFFQHSRSCVGLDAQRCEACLIDCDGCIQRFALQHELEKLTFMPDTDTYLAAPRRCSGRLYILDRCFREVDSFAIRLDEPPLDGLWFDADSGLIWIASGSHIIRANLNGDSLGAFLTAPAGTSFQVLCTFENFLFASYCKSNCAYLAKYTKQGAYLEKISLGGEYSVCNLQMLPGDDALLCAYTIKSHCFPRLITMETGCSELSAQNRSSGLSVECVSENCGICSTCNVSSVRQQ